MGSLPRRPPAQSRSGHLPAVTANSRRRGTRYCSFHTKREAIELCGPPLLAGLPSSTKRLFLPWGVHPQVPIFPLREWPQCLVLLTSVHNRRCDDREQERASGFPTGPCGPSTQLRHRSNLAWKAGGEDWEQGPCFGQLGAGSLRFQQLPDSSGEPF